MYTVEMEKYPVNKEWEDKIFSTPNVPGGKTVLTLNLRKLLLAIESHLDANSIPKLENTNSKATLAHICQHVLGPMNFISRTKDGYWELTEASRIWLESEDDLYLAAYFCANVRFFAEILYYLDEPKTAAELFSIAVNEYSMAWKITTTINNRLIWLRQFKLIDYQEYSLKYAITDLGRDFLRNVCPIMPEEIEIEDDYTKDETEVQITEEFVEYLRKNKDAHRKTGIGYFPGKPDKFDETINDAIRVISQNGCIEEISDIYSSRYKISASSTRTFFNTLSTLGIIQRKDNFSYEVTDLAHLYLVKNNTIDLLFLFQAKSLFVFEMLQEMNEKCVAPAELAVIAKLSYGFDRENTNEMRNRLALFMKMGLVLRVPGDKYILSNRGKLFCDYLSDQIGLNLKTAPVPLGVQESPSRDIIAELRYASKDSVNPDKFEKLVSDYFSMLGFESEWIGGSGNTDVLLRTAGVSNGAYVVSVDAKSTSAQSVTDALVDFDTLKEHQKKHESNYIAIVGRAFDSERLVQRAVEHDVALLDIDVLARLLEIQSNTPLKHSVLRRIFEQSGKVDLSVLDEEINREQAFGLLIKAVMECLILEENDPVTQGKLTVRDMYLSLRRDTTLSPKLVIEDIEMVLSFLSSPIVGAVNKEKDLYYAISSINETSRVFSFLQESIKR